MKKHNYTQKLLARSNANHYARAATIAIGLGIIGTVFLLTSHAATSVVATEPESGTIAAPAAQVTDATASAGKAVKFGASSGTTTWGWQLDGTNTGLESFGIDKTKLPLYTGSCNPASGTTISNVQITCQLVLSNSNITFDHVWIHPSGSFSNTDLIYLTGGSTIKNSDIDGSSMNMSSPGRAAISVPFSGNYTIDNVNISGLVVSVFGDSNGIGTINHSFLNSNIAPNGAFHVDGYTRRQGTGKVTISSSHIIANTNGETTGAFFLQTTNGLPIDNVILKDSLLDGQGYLMPLDDTNGAGIGLSVDNIRFNGFGTYYGPVSVSGPVTFHSWTSNYIYNSADPVNSTDGGGKGTVVNHP